MQDQQQFEQLILQYNQLKNGAEEIKRMIEIEELWKLFPENITEE